MPVIKIPGRCERKGGGGCIGGWVKPSDENLDQGLLLWGNVRSAARLKTGH